MSIHFLEDVTTDAAVEHGALDDMEFRVLAFQVLYGLVDAAATRRSKEYDLDRKSTRLNSSHRSSSRMPSSA